MGRQGVVDKRVTSISDFARIGNPDAPVGSPEWCLAAHFNLRQHKHNHDAEVASLKYGLREFKTDKRWRQLADRKGRKFRYWEDYVQYPEPYGLEMPVEEAEAVIEARDDKRLLRDVLSARYQALEEKDRGNPSRQGQRTDLVYTEINDIHEVTRPTGTSAEAFLRRLRKGRPDIHARVLAGELTAHAGMVEAGFRKPRSRRIPVLAKILKLVPELTPEERRRLREILS
jgi:hypothetical protein